MYHNRIPEVRKLSNLELSKLFLPLKNYKKREKKEKYIIIKSNTHIDVYLLYFYVYPSYSIKFITKEGEGDLQRTTIFYQASKVRRNY